MKLSALAKARKLTASTQQPLPESSPASAIVALFHSRESTRGTKYEEDPDRITSCTCIGVDISFS